jgi:hypothetical protein
MLPIHAMSACRATAVACLSFVAVLVWARPSRACSIAFETLLTNPTCGALPDGALVFSHEPPVSTSGDAAWTEDRVFSSLMERSASELRVSELPPSNPLLRAWRRSGAGAARTSSVPVSHVEPIMCAIEVGGAPRPATPAPLGDVDTRVVYTDGGSGGGGCSCPEIDSMTMRLKTPPPVPRPPYVVAWFGTDANGALADREPDALFATGTANSGGGLAKEESDRTFEITLGIASDHERTGFGFGRTGRYCFSLAWANQLGTIGERSPATCLDTTDPADPLVNVDEKAACICVFAGRRPLGSGALTFFAMTAVVTFARRLVRRRAVG